MAENDNHISIAINDAATCGGTAFSLIPLEFVRAGIPAYARPTIDLIREALNEQGFTASDQSINDAYREYCERKFCAGWLDIPDIERARGQIRYIMEFLGRVA